MTAQWCGIRKNLQKSLESGIFKVWIAPLEGSVEGTVVRLAAPNGFVADWIRERLADAVRDAAAPEMGVPAHEVTIDVAVASTVARPVRRPAVASVPAAPEIHIPAAAPDVQAVLPLQQPLIVPKAVPANWRYRFDDFVVGPTNEVAVAAARDLCRKATSVETLFVSSGSGLGKTHLVQAMGYVLSEEMGQSGRVAYMTAEEFASRFVTALRTRDVESFKSHLRGLDVLMLEDVHFLQGKEKMQDEALATIKSLQARGSRVVLTSSFTPRELRNVDSQLVSHFCSGLLANIAKPTLDMRRSILDRKARMHQVMLPEPVTDLLAERLCSDVRQLESCLNNLIFKARHLRRNISLEMALDVLGQYAQVETILDVENIIRLVCESYGLNLRQLASRSRKHECVLARNTIYYLARKHTELSLQEIGDKFNRRHSTVIKGITSLEREIQRETSVGRQIANTVTLIERNAGLSA